MLRAKLSRKMQVSQSQFICDSLDCAVFLGVCYRLMMMSYQMYSMATNSNHLQSSEECQERYGQLQY